MGSRLKPITRFLRFAYSDLSVVYDVFSDAVSLQGEYMNAQDAAGSPAEEKLWLDRVIALRNYRDAIDTDDRDAVYKALVVVETERL